MNYFYILITKKENILFLTNTIELIIKYCLKDSNEFSISINKSNHSNCTFDNQKESHLQLYETKINNYEEYKEFYKNKYSVNNQDLEVLFNVYHTINIESIEEMKVQVKINYNFGFINALQLIIDLLGSEEPLNNIFNNKNGEIFNQMIVNEHDSQCALVENNHIYTAIYENGSYKKLTKIEKNEILNKYGQYKKLDDKFALKIKKEIHKI